MREQHTSSITYGFLSCLFEHVWAGRLRGSDPMARRVLGQHHPSVQPPAQCDVVE